MEEIKPFQMDISIAYTMRGRAEDIFREIERGGQCSVEKTAMVGIKIYYPRTGWRHYSLGAVAAGDIRHASDACGQLLRQGRIKEHEAEQIDALLSRLADITA